MASSTLADELFSQLQGEPLERISRQLGTDPQQASTAVGAALPLLLGALGRNASQPQGAEALLGALNRDHSGMDPGSVLGAVLGGLGGGASGRASMGGASMGGGLGDLLGSLGGAVGGRGAGGASGGGLGDLLGGLLGGGGPADQGDQGAPSLNGKQGDLDGLLGHIFGGQQQRAEQGLGQATGIGGGGGQALLKILAPIVMSFLAQRFAQPGVGADGLGQALTHEREALGRQGGLGGGLMGAVLDQDGDGDVDLNDLLKLGAGVLGGRR